jgi:hypothetical protein
MPGYDGTGPMGMGPLTGGARGMCNTNVGNYGRRGFIPRLGRSRGRGFRNMFWATGQPGWIRGGLTAGAGDYPAPYSKEQELNFLRDQSAALKSELDAIHSRLQALESEEKESH